MIILPIIAFLSKKFIYFIYFYYEEAFYNDFYISFYNMCSFHFKTYLKLTQI